MRATRMTEEQRALASEPRYLSMARAIARGFADSLPHLAEDIESAALFGLCDAAMLYDPARSREFSTCLTCRVYGEIRDMLRDCEAKGYRRKGAPAPRILSIDYGYAFGADDAGRRECFTMADATVSDEGPVGWEAEYEDEVRALADRAGANGRAILAMYTNAAATTYRRAGEAIGLSEARAFEMHGKAIEALRRRYGGVNPADLILAGSAARDRVA